MVKNICVSTIQCLNSSKLSSVGCAASTHVRYSILEYEPLVTFECGVAHGLRNVERRLSGLIPCSHTDREALHSPPRLLGYQQASEGGLSVPVTSIPTEAKPCVNSETSTD